MQRIRLLDILRGFAIIGTLGTNIWVFASVGDIDFLVGQAENPFWSSAEAMVQALLMLLVNGKFLGMLTILFGVGLEIKRRQAERQLRPWPGIYVWSSFLLFLDGLIHFILVMEYDVLMSYAVTAIIVAYIVKRSTKVIKWAMSIAGSIHVAFMVMLTMAISSGEAAMGDTNTIVYTTGTWWEQVLYRLDNFLIFRAEAIFIIPMNILLFLTGVMLMRSGAFAVDEKGKVIRRKMLIWGVGVGGPLHLLVLVSPELFAMSQRYLFAPLLALGYMALIAKLMEKREDNWLAARIEKVGKMALSCYIMQNILASIIFYGWGLNLHGFSKEHYAWFPIAMWLLIVVILIIFSHVWLRYFKLGPFEWVWKQTISMTVKQKPAVTTNNKNI
ncbi:DUF418 domain-containing protein [Paenibacillus sp. SC116]|uniref:DUF418 domain-containing protein n=1 Tax=Paenibacillus sp. SC116 TaxID=2968986 RepID=UPI00215A9A6F|nr:DUF418 domain-containing protein [Paenibacillus sp. SC116]MCR8842713.1 DUF418 domain-containing protein [Paenibacillus sp. SC116]